MEYQININYQFNAANEAEAKEQARQYINDNLTVTATKPLLCSPAEVARECRSFRGSRKEHFCVFFLDTQHRIVGKETISIGTLNANLIHPRETFRSAITKSSSSIIVAHNHPGGSLEPSPEDLHVTKRLVDAGKLLGIEILDHVIVTKESYSSFRERGLI